MVRTIQIKETPQERVVNIILGKLISEGQHSIIMLKADEELKNNSEWCIEDAMNRLLKAGLVKVSGEVYSLNPIKN